MSYKKNAKSNITDLTKKAPSRLKNPTRRKGIRPSNASKRHTGPNKPKTGPLIASKSPTGPNKPKTGPNIAIKKPTKPKPKTSKAELHRLQREWYAKLAADGFKDIEHFYFGESEHRPKGRPEYLLKDYPTAAFAKKTDWDSSYTYYMRLRNFLTHKPRWTADRIKLLVAKRHTAGVPFSQIVTEVRAKGLHPKFNKWHVHHLVKEFVAYATRWNQNHPEGLDFVPDIGPTTTKRYTGP